MSTFWKTTFVMLTLALIAILALRWYSRKPHFSLFLSPITHLSRELPQIALTFDDGPSPKITPALLDLLARHQIKATFFVNGIHLENHPALAQRAIREGHLLCNHTYQHENMAFRSRSFIRQDLLRTDSLLRLIGQQDLYFYRPTFGDKFINLPLVLKAQGKKMVTWDVNPPAQYQGHFEQSVIVEQVLSKVQNGSIITLHDTESWATPLPAFLAAVEEIIQSLQQKGFEFVLLEESSFD